MELRPGKCLLTRQEFNDLQVAIMNAPTGVNDVEHGLRAIGATDEQIEQCRGTERRIVLVDGSGSEPATCRNQDAPGGW